MTTVARKPRREADPAGTVIPPGVAARLARAVAVPGERGREVTPGNGLGAWRPVEDAAAVALAVPVREEVVALDHDDPGRAARAAGEVARAIAERGWRPVVGASGRPGGRHVLARVPDPVARAEVLALAGRLGFDPRAWIRPPGSPHRLGAAWRLLEPPDPLEALRALEAPPRPPIGERWARMLDTGRGPTGDRSRDLYRLAAAARVAGWTWPDYREAVLASAAGAKVRDLARERGQAAADRWLARTWERAGDYTAAHPVGPDGGDGPARVAEVAAAHARAPWPDKSGTTDRQVLAAILARAEAAGTPEVAASSRDVALAAGVGRDTAERSVRRLRADGWLAVAQAPDRGRSLATVHRLQVPAERRNEATYTPPSRRESSGLIATLTPDAFRTRRGLSAGAWQVLAAVVADPGADLPALAAAVGKRRNGKGRHDGTRRHLARLAGLGLIVGDGGGWRAPDDLDARLADLADLLGTAGATRRQADRIDRQRAARALVLARLRAAQDRDGKGQP